MEVKNNYNVCLTNVACSIRKYFDLDYKHNTLKEIDGVDIIIGTNYRTKILDFIEKYKKNKEKIIKIDDVNHLKFENMKLDKFENHTRAFVKIQDGCNNFCSYCIIPYTRGNIRSKDKNLVIEEVTNLVNNGYKEVVLTGIHTGHYGLDLENYDFSDLLNELEKIEGLERIRISSIEIKELNEKFINTLKNSKKIVNHIHIPLQSGCDKILELMNRRYNMEFYFNKIEEIRKIRPDIAITTDVIVGFPDESEEDFNITKENIKKLKFTELHVFPYSKRENTKAANMKNQIDGNIKKERVRELINLSNDLKNEYYNKFNNKTDDLLVEKFNNGILIGHLSNYGKVKVEGKKEDVNKIIKVKLLDYKDDCYNAIKLEV